MKIIPAERFALSAGCFYFAGDDAHIVPITNIQNLDCRKPAKESLDGLFVI